MRRAHQIADPSGQHMARMPIITRCEVSGSVSREYAFVISTRNTKRLAVVRARRRIAAFWNPQCFIHPKGSNEPRGRRSCVGSSQRKPLQNVELGSRSLSRKIDTSDLHEDQSSLRYASFGAKALSPPLPSPPLPPGQPANTYSTYSGSASPTTYVISFPITQILVYLPLPLW